MGNNTRFYLKPISYLFSAFCFGAASLFLPAFINENQGYLNAGGILIKSLQWVADESGAICIGLFLVAFTLHLANEWVQGFWDGNIQPLLNQYAEKIKESTDAAQSAINEFQADITDKIKHNNLDLAVVHSNHEAVQSRLPVIHEKAFGEHCSKEKSLYNHINNTIGKFLDPRTPHRSDYFQEIHISERDGKIVWQETTQYSLHTIAFDNEYKTPFDGSIEPYELVVKSQAKYENLSELKIEIFVDEKLLVSTENSLTVISNDPLQIQSSDRNVKVSTCGDLVLVELTCSIEINKAFTKLRAFEQSILSPEDGHYLSKITQPTFTFQQTITLPDDWSFDFFYPAAADWQEPIQRQSKRTIRKIGWITPGILMSCRWKRAGE